MSCLSGKSLFVVLLIRVRGKQQSVNYTAAGLSEVREDGEKENKHSVPHEMNARSSQAKLTVLSVHLGNVAAKIVQAWIAAMHV